MIEEEETMVRVENSYGEFVEYTEEEWEDHCVAEEIAREERLADQASAEGEDE